MRLILIINLFISCLFATSLELSIEEQNYIKNQKEPIKIGVLNSYKPFSFLKNGKEIGYTQDLLKIISQKSGLKFKKITGSWSTIYPLFKDGKVDMISEISYREDRVEFTEFTDPYYEVPLGVFSNGFFEYKDLTSLENKRVVVIKDSFLKSLLEKIQGIKIIEVNSTDEKFQTLLSNNADIVISSAMSILYTDSLVYKDINLSGYFEHSEVKKEDLRFGMQKTNKLLTSIIKKSFNSIDYVELTKLKHKWIFGSDSNPIIQKLDLTFEEQEAITNNLTFKEEQFLEKHPVIRFRVRPNRAPFEFEENGKAVGIAVDYVRKSAQNMGLKAEFIVDNSPMKEAYKMLSNSREKFDTVLFSVKSPERDKAYSFGSDYLSYPMMIITHKDAPYIGSLKYLEGKTIVLEEGFLTNKWIKRDYPNINIINTNDTKTALEMVNEGKVLAYVGNMGVANYMSVFGGMDNLKIAAPSDYGNVNYSFIGPKEWPELTSILTKGYKKIVPIEHTALQQKWFSVQTIDRTNYKTIGTILVILVFIILWILWWNRKLSIERQKTELALSDLQKLKEELELKSKEVYESQQFLQTMIDEIPSPVFIKNYEGKFILVNKTLANLYNTTKDSMIGKDDGDFINSKKMVEFFKHSVKEIMDSGKTTVVYEDSQDVNSGETRNFMSIKKPFKNIDGKRAILVVANDITDVKKLEAEKLRNQEILFSQSKVAAMGEMIGNIAHQWRQPLSVISTASTGLIMEKEIGVLTDEKLKTTLESINDYAQYLSTTIDTFRDYVKTEKVYKEVMLQDRIKVALNIVEASFKNNYISIKTNLDQLEPIKIKLVVGELSEVLINILNNSKDALKERKVKKDPWVNIVVNSLKEKVIITIEDNAGGIPQEIISKIFEPYFTTKHQSQGTGLGLHMSYKIITESLHGKIYADNTENGAIFTIELPQT